MIRLLTYRHAHIVHDYSQKTISAKELPQPLDILLRFVEEDEQGPRQDAKLYSTSSSIDGQIDPVQVYSKE